VNITNISLGSYCKQQKKNSDTRNKIHVMTINATVAFTFSAGTTIMHELGHTILVFSMNTDRIVINAPKYTTHHAMNGRKFSPL
jgi:hypothetical protein